jgi:hypothetical protein
MKRYLIVLALVVLVPFAAGCATAGPNARSGGLLGAAIGAGTGAIVGHQLGHRGPGAVIGAGVGALTGSLIGNALDRSEAENAARTERALREVRSTRQRSSMSVLEVVRMSQAGLSDGVIIAKIDQSGARFDLSSQDIIDLKKSGVSDGVLQHMLERPAAADVGPEYYRSTPTRTIYRTTTYRAYPWSPRRLGFRFTYHRCD